MRRRWMIYSLLLATTLWVALVGRVAAQDPGRNPGSMPQNALFRTSHLFAQALLFIIGLGIFAGLYRVRTESEKRATGSSDGAVRRHSWSDVGLHWLNAVGFLIGLGTAAMLLRWVDRVLDLQLIYVLHYVGAAFIAYAFFNVVTHSLVGGHTGLLPGLRDVPDAVGELVGYLGVFGEPGVFGIRFPRLISAPITRLLAIFGIRKPKEVGKYLATEKVLSLPIWAILAGLILISGLVKTLRYAWPIPTEIVALATWVHDLTSIAIVVWLVAHVAPTTLIPRNWPLLKSMFITKVPEEYVKAHHPAWYEELRSITRSPEKSEITQELSRETEATERAARGETESAKQEEIHHPNDEPNDGS